MAHHCHATECTNVVSPTMFMCPRHWRMVPRPMQQRVWATYREGQCEDWSPSTEYCQAARDAVIAVAQKEGREPDTVLYDMFETRAHEQAKSRMACRKCGKGANAIGGWLERVNEKGVSGIWECRPTCDALLPYAEKVAGAIAGCEAEESTGQ